jgi:hypothetical protein
VVLDRNAFRVRRTSGPDVTPNQGDVADKICRRLQFRMMLFLIPATG